MQNLYVFYHGDAKPKMAFSTKTRVSAQQPYKIEKHTQKVNDSVKIYKNPL